MLVPCLGAPAWGELADFLPPWISSLSNPKLDFCPIHSLLMLFAFFIVKIWTYGKIAVVKQLLHLTVFASKFHNSPEIVQPLFPKADCC